MNSRTASDRFMTHSHRLVHWIGYLLIVVLALRRINDLVGIFSTGLTLSLMGLFTVLYASEPLLSKRMQSYPRIYLVVQMILVQTLGVFQEYQDTWAVLYIVLGFQVAGRCARKEAVAWFSLFVASLMITLSAEFGWISGPGRAMAYIVIGVLIISYDVQYAYHEDALGDSQMLVAELQEANLKLEENSTQAEKLAAMQERNRMIQELYDSVGQKVFAIQLAAEATQLLLEKDPGRAAEQIEDLRVQTQSALGQMRQLIGQWHPV